MDILGTFLASDVAQYGDVYTEWALDTTKLRANGNLIALEKEENDTITLTDMYNQSSSPVIMKLTADQLIQILEDWQQNVCEQMPKEVTITHTNDQFIIETRAP